MARIRLPAIPLDGDRRRIFGWICLLIAVNQLGFGSIVPVVPLYAESFGVEATAIGLTIAVYGLARFLIAVPAGRIADSHGRRWTLLLGGVLTVLGNLACAAAPDYTVFLLARFVAGAGASMVLTGGQIILADIAPPHVRGRVMAIYQGVFLFAVGAGALPGGFLATQFGLRTPFIAYAILAAGVSFLAWRRVPETRNLRSAATAPVSTAATASPASPAAPPALAVMAVVPPFWQQMRFVWSTPGLLWIGFVSFTSFFARTGGLFNVVPLLAEDEMQLSPDQIGLGLGLVSIAGLLFTVPAGILVDKFGRKPVIVPSTLLSASAMLAFAFAPSFGWYVVACAWWGTASGISGAAPAAYAADTARAGQTAATLGGYGCSRTAATWWGRCSSGSSPISARRRAPSGSAPCSLSSPDSGSGDSPRRPSLVAPRSRPRHLISRPAERAAPPSTGKHRRHELCFVPVASRGRPACPHFSLAPAKTTAYSVAAYHERQRTPTRDPEGRLLFPLAAPRPLRSQRCVPCVVPLNRVIDSKPGGREPPAHQEEPMTDPRRTAFFAAALTGRMDRRRVLATGLKLGLATP
jgi:predicted MFS family arabinose efflux permease